VIELSAASPEGGRRRHGHDIVQNSGQVLSIGIFLLTLLVGLASRLPGSLYRGLVEAVDPRAASHAAHLPRSPQLFATFLGYNPVRSLLGAHALAALIPAQAARLTGRTSSRTC